MKNNQIEKALKSAVEEAPLLSFDMLASMTFKKVAMLDDNTIQGRKKVSNYLMKFALTAACILAVFITTSNWYIKNKMKDSVITLDVNPSIEIITNQKNQILSLKALNQDALIVLDSVELRQDDLKKTVHAITVSLVDNDYLTTNKNAVLITVKNKNSKKAYDVLGTVNDAIKENLVEQNIEPIILKQICNWKEDNSKLAQRFHVSEGKIELIHAISAKSKQYTMQQLAPKSMVELLKIAKEYSVNLSVFLSVTSDDGTGSPKPTPGGNDNKSLPETKEKNRSEDRMRQKSISQEKQYDEDMNEKDIEEHKADRKDTEYRYKNEDLEDNYSRNSDDLKEYENRHENRQENIEENDTIGNNEDKEGESEYQEGYQENKEGDLEDKEKTDLSSNMEKQEYEENNIKTGDSKESSNLEYNYEKYNYEEDKSTVEIQDEGND